MAVLSKSWSLSPQPLKSSQSYDLLSQTQFSSVQSLSRDQLFATPWTAALQASLSMTSSRNLPKLITIE